MKIKVDGQDCEYESNVKCRVEGRIEEVVERFSKLAEKLTDNQIEMRMSIVKLSENMQDLKRVHTRIDKIETDVKKMTPLVYKMVGVASAFAVAVPILIGVFLK